MSMISLFPFQQSSHTSSASFNQSVHPDNASHPLTNHITKEASVSCMISDVTYSVIRINRVMGIDRNETSVLGKASKLSLYDLLEWT